MAVRPGDIELVSAALGTEFDVIICHTLASARSNLSDRIGLIACGVHFDSGSMFDFLQIAKANAATRTVPFHILIGNGEDYSKLILEGIRSAAMVLGASGMTDLMRLTNDLGKDHAYERLREVVRNALG